MFVCLLEGVGVQDRYTATRHNGIHPVESSPVFFFFCFKILQSASIKNDYKSIWRDYMLIQHFTNHSTFPFLSSSLLSLPIAHHEKIGHYFDEWDAEKKSQMKQSIWIFKGKGTKEERKSIWKMIGGWPETLLSDTVNVRKYIELLAITGFCWL
jgi:hypothetical protein